MERLHPEDEHVVQFLERVAALLVQLFDRTGRWFLAHAYFTSKQLTGETSIKIDSLPEGYGLFCRSNASGRQDRYLRGVANVPP